MADIRLPKTLFVMILLSALAESIRNFPLLPDRVASHFAPSGVPTNWVSRPAFFTLYVGLVLLAAALGFLLPQKIAGLPPSKINLPYKEYWMAPAQRAATVAFFEQYFAWYGCIFLLLEAIAMHMVMEANLNLTLELPTTSVVVLIALFLLFNIAAIVTVFRRFKNPYGKAEGIAED